MVDGNKPSTNIYSNSGVVRTDLYCHACSKNFIAALDYSKNGQHAIACPRCGHLHYRTIRDGRVTDDRWRGSNQEHIEVPKKNIWTTDDGITTVASAFLREKWLNIGQD